MRLSDVTLTLKRWLFSDTLMQVLMGMLGALIVLIFVHFVPPFETPRIATVDIAGITNRFIAEQARQNLPANILKERVINFGHALEKSIDKVSKQNSFVLMPKEAVMAGAKDVTSLVEQNIQRISKMPPEPLKKDKKVKKEG